MSVSESWNEVRSSNSAQSKLSPCGDLIQPSFLESGDENEVGIFITILFLSSVRLNTVFRRAMQCEFTKFIAHQVVSPGFVEQIEALIIIFLRWYSRVEWHKETTDGQMVKFPIRMRAS